MKVAKFKCGDHVICNGGSHYLKRGVVKTMRVEVYGGFTYGIDFGEGESADISEDMLTKTSPIETKDVADAPAETRVGYYQMPNGCQAWDLARYLDFNCGVAVKYCTRAGRKHEMGMSDKEKQLEDLNKAMDHIHDEIVNVLGGECKYKLK